LVVQRYPLSQLFSKKPQTQTQCEDPGGMEKMNWNVGSIIAIAVTVCGTIAAAADQPVRLNNLVVVHLDLESPQTGTFEFTFEDAGWVFVRTRDGRENAQVLLSGLKAPLIAYGANESGTREAMRRISAGRHRVTLTGGGVGRLEVRRVPEIRYCKFQYDPWVYHDGPYDWQFLTKWMLPHVNTIIGQVGIDQSQWATAWRERGGRWIVERMAPGIDRRGLEEKLRTITADEVYQGLLDEEGTGPAYIDGQIFDEYFPSLEFLFEPTVAALQRIQSEKRLANKSIDLYIAADADDVAELTRGALAAGSFIALETYNPEQPTEAEAKKFLQRRLADAMSKYRQVQAGAQKRMIVALGILSAPPESLDVYPQVNYRKFQDLEFQVLANDPALEDLFGVMTYTSGYAEEETIRWVGKLYRHYCIEGHTKPLCDEPYHLPHLDNPDFTEGTSDWDIQPAGENSIEVRQIKDVGYLAARYGTRQAGNQCLIMTRSAARPNRIQQTIKDLTPGCVYSLRMYSFPIGALARGYGNPVFDDVSKLDIAIDGAELVEEKCFDHIYRSVHTSELKYFNYHVRRFRASASTAKLTISDWMYPNRRVGNVGRQTGMHFVEVRPYLDDSMP